MATREVLVDGSSQSVPPKVFDLLAFLLLQRHRAVSKQELVDEVWRGAELSDSVLSRTVILARRLVGDSADNPVWIQNVYGFGYRMGGHIRELAQAPVTAEVLPVRTDTAERQRRIGLLPLDNQTQEPSLRWTQVGLMALVGHAVERDQRLITSAIGADFMQQLPAGMNIAAAAREACELYGLDFVVHSVLRSQSEALWLDFQMFNRIKLADMGSLRDGDPIALGERLAKAVAGLVIPGAHSSGAMPSRDTFVNQAFARAMECTSTQDWRTAVALLGAGTALEPENLIIELERVRCLVWLKDPEGLSSAQALLERLKDVQTPRLLSGCHNLLAQALSLTGDRSLVAAAADHRQKALDWANQSGPTDWAVAMRINAGTEVMDTGQYDLAREHLNRALEDSRLTGNLRGLAIAQQNLAIADRIEGNLLLAKQRVDEAVQIWRRYPRQRFQGHALSQLAHLNLSLGLLNEARQQCDEALACFNLDQLKTYDGATVCSLSLLYVELGGLEAVVEIERNFLAGFPPAERKNSVPFHAALGCAAVARGRCDEARQHLYTATQHSGVWPGLSFRLRCVLTLLRLELAGGSIEQLEECCKRFESLSEGMKLPEWKAGLRYAQAAIHLLQNDRVQAMNLLRGVATELPLGHMSQLACLDAAWLLLESGDADAAENLMNSAPNWRDAHPAGLSLKARSHAAHGRYLEAYQLQLQAQGQYRRPLASVHAELLGLYGQAASNNSDSRPDIPHLPRLLSATWSYCSPSVSMEAAPEAAKIKSKSRIPRGH